MFHKVNANVLDKNRRELARKHPLWTGDVDSAKQAIGAAHALLGPIFEGEPRADSIVLHITDAKGGVLTSTEYAEDWRIGRGASLGSNLLSDGADHGLTPEEVDAAKQALTKSAIQAMPSVAEKVAEKSADPIADFFGGKRPSEERNTRRGSYGQVNLDGTGIEDISIEGENVTHINGNPSSNREFRDIIKRVADRQESKLGQPNFGLSDLIDAAKQLKEAGRDPSEIVMGRAHYEHLKKLLGDPGKVGDIRQFQGLKITVHDNPNAPPMQVVPKPRSQFFSGGPVDPGRYTIVMDEAHGIDYGAIEARILGRALEELRRPSPLYQRMILGKWEPAARTATEEAIIAREEFNAAAQCRRMFERMYEHPPIITID